MSTRSRVVLKPRRARPFFARHPWLFDSSIERVDGEPAAGDQVEVVASDGQLIAQGLYNPASSIRVRLYRWDDGALDEEFWRGRLEAALRLRTQVLGSRMDADPSAGRVVFSEGDGLSGITVDRYDRWLVAQFTSLALYARRDMFLRLLLNVTGAIGVMARTERGIAEKEGLRPGEEFVAGDLPEGPVEIVEHGLAYTVDLRAGPKTGFYLDQRDNRLAAAAYARGRRVLDLCCFSGAFSLCALRLGGAASTLGIDSSSAAIDQAKTHAARNGLEGARFENGEALSLLSRMRDRGDRFGLVVCDPPRFARQAKDVERALKGYLRLNMAAVEVLEPDGVLVTCSCSGLVSRELFAEVIASVAEQSGRSIQILEQRGQAPDHPVSASCLETEYLKCLICHVGA
jgi:23S rRNA (cytosine1962-C5)-methyltransferase